MVQNFWRPMFPLALSLLALFSLAGFRPGSAQTTSILHSFSDGTVSQTGRTPLASLIQGSDGNFYGTTQNGGSGGLGTIFRVTPSGGETILHNFQGSPGDGSFPESALVLGSDGNFYGTTGGGGSANQGTTFKVTLTGTETVLHSFNDGTVQNDGRTPKASLFLAGDGNFYGTTQYGGAGGFGTIFKMTPAGTEAVLHSFQGYPNDGAHSEAALVLGGDGDLYGTTADGGSAGNGAVFKVTLAGAMTILYNFQGYPNDGSNSSAALLLGSDGNFYGTTKSGGPAGFGTVFNITPAGTETVLHKFEDGTIQNDGAWPQAALISGADGDYYGTTSSGSPGPGTVFKITSTGTVSILYHFQGQFQDGASPFAALIPGRDGSFYGTTAYGSYGIDGGHGTVFKITPSGAETVLYDFGTEVAPEDGTLPYGSLILGRDGSFYGTTESGGSTLASDPYHAGSGTIFKVAANGTETVLHNFGDGTVPNDGTLPQDLIQGGDGDFYGATYYGGTADRGTIFKITPAGAETILHSFGDGTVPNDGSYPTAAPIMGSDGNFYGTTTYGGSATSTNNPLGAGTIFKMTPAGVVTILHDFGDGTVPNDGAVPQAALILGSDGSFYGTTGYGGMMISGGPNGGGTVFKVTPAGTETILHDFQDSPSDGSYPTAALVLGSDGDFYGAASNGGAGGYGIVFKMTPAGIETVLHDFSDGTVQNDGYFPAHALVLGSDGNLYGVAHSGGSTVSADLSRQGYGILFRITPTGTETILHDFQDGTVQNDGRTPESDLVIGGDGAFYGTTVEGGSDDAGTVFRFSLTTAPTPTIIGIDPASAVVGTSVTVTGAGFTGATSVTVDGVSAAFKVINDTTITFVIPAGLAGGIVAVTAPGGITTGGPSLTVLTWNCKDVAAVADGTARMLWDRSDGAAGIWALNAADTQTAVGTVYGPYSDSAGAWSAKAISAASDGTTKMLWTKSDGTASVWTMSAAGTQTLTGPSYGPYSDSHGTWSAADIAAGPGGTSRVLWVKSDGTASVWTMNASDAQATTGPSYGPYSGWTAKAVGAAGDGTAHVLWTNVNRTAGLWTMNAADVETSTGTVYGPYSDSGGTWTAGDMATNSDGTSNVLWNRSDGSAGVWTFSAAGTETTVGTVYGPYSGFTAAALDAAGDKSRVLWVRSDRAAGIWSFGTNDVQSVVGTTYGPY